MNPANDGKRRVMRIIISKNLRMRFVIMTHRTRKISAYQLVTIS